MLLHPLSSSPRVHLYISHFSSNIHSEVSPKNSTGVICSICKQTLAANKADTLAPEIPWRHCNAMYTPTPNSSLPVKQSAWYTVCTPNGRKRSAVICKWKSQNTKHYPKLLLHCSTVAQWLESGCPPLIQGAWFHHTPTDMIIRLLLEWSFHCPWPMHWPKNWCWPAHGD